MEFRYIQTKHVHATVAYKQETTSDRDLSIHEHIIHDLYDEKLELEKQNEELIRENRELKKKIELNELAKDY